jgi:hypothetical protein
MVANGERVPVQKPNKQLQDMAATSTVALKHVENVRRFSNDPWFQANVLGPVEGRIAKGEEIAGIDVPGATEEQTKQVQNFLTSLNYLFFREGRPLFGGRPPERLMEMLKKTSPSPQMSPARFNGAMDAVQQSANMAIQAHRDWMFGSNASANAVFGAVAPPKSVTDKWPVGDNTLRNGQVWRKDSNGRVELVK